MANQKTVDQVISTLINIVQKHDKVVFANSFGVEDMVLMDLIAKNTPTIKIVTLDTGRLHEETYQLMDRARKYYGLPIEVYYPDTSSLQAWIKENGVNAFYNSTELRKGCCEIRKVEPLQRALREQDAWITGLRQQQAPTRTTLSLSDWDSKFGLQKYNPLVKWTEDDVWSYVHVNNVPYNSLHDKGFTSIGCEPCTRAITPGEDIRAGRWWWELPESKECGLHTIKKLSA